MTKVTGMYCLGTFNICFKFPGNPSNSCKDITLWIQMSTSWWKVNEKSEDDQSHCSSRILSLGTINVCTKDHGNPSNCCHDISVWTNVVDWPTDKRKKKTGNIEGKKFQRTTWAQKKCFLFHILLIPVLPDCSTLIKGGFNKARLCNNLKL